MTSERANEIERSVLYRHIEDLMRDLEECENAHVVFNVGRRIGMMQMDLKYELKKEIQNNESSDSEKLWR